MQICESYAALFFDLVYRTEYDSLAALVALPYRYRSRPVSVSGDVPVTGIFEPLAESAVLNGLGYPVDILVLGDQLVLDLGNIEVPGIHSLVYQRSLTSPAVRIVMLDGTVSNSLTLLVKEADNCGVHLDNVLLAVLLIEVGYFLGESALCVNGVHQRDSVVLAGPVVVLTESGSGMYDTNTFVSADIVSCDNSECLIFKICKIGEEGLISSAYQFLALCGLYYLGFLAEDLVISGKNCGTSDEYLVAYVAESIFKILAYCQTQV